MSRVEQPVGVRGSLKWIQAAVNGRPEVLDTPILGAVGRGSSVKWLSPLREDAYAEYRDSAFLNQLGVTDLDDVLASFWPRRGPQWDALGRTDSDDLLLIEAKAHVAEMFSPGTQATGASREGIERALAETAEALGAQPKADWTLCFYQYANRLAHLHFLRSRGKPAWLVLVSFTGDDDMNGPETAEVWRAAYSVMDHVMGLRKDHALARYIVHLHPHVAELTEPVTAP